MKTEAEQRHCRSPPLRAEPKLRRVRENFFRKSKNKKFFLKDTLLDFVYIFDFDFLDFEILNFFIFFNYLFHREIKVG